MNREEQRTVFPFPTADFQLKQVQGEGWDLVFFGFGFGFFWILFFVFFLNNLFIYFWLCWVFVSVRGLSPAAASGGHSPPRCAGPLTAAAPPLVAEHSPQTRRLSSRGPRAQPLRGMRDPP